MRRILIQEMKGLSSRGRQYPKQRVKDEEAANHRDKGKKAVQPRKVLFVGGQSRFLLIF